MFGLPNGEAVCLLCSRKAFMC